MRFGSEAWLLALAAVPLVGLLLHARDRRARRELTSLLGGRFAVHVEGQTLRLRPWRRFLLLAGLASLAVALARPQWGAHELVVKERGTDIVIALDVSNSMLAGDVAPSRLERARSALDAFLALPGRGRIGVVLFAGAAYVQCPLTLDYATARLFLRQAAPDMISAQGTALGQALDTALGLLERGGGLAAESARRAIVLVTDGEDFEGGWEREAERCRQSGVMVVAVGVGDERGGLIPVTDDAGRAAGYLKDDEGRVVLTRPDPDVLRRLAEATGGVALAIGPGGLDPARLRAPLARLGERDLEDRRIAALEERFQGPLVLAILCLALRELLRPWRSRARRAALGLAGALLVLGAAGAVPEARASGLRPEGAGLADQGLAHFRAGRYEEALRAFESARALSPDDPRLAQAVGSALAKLGRLSDAAREFRRAAALADAARERASGLYDAGTALLQEGEADAAAGLLRESLALEPGREDAVRNLELALRRLRQQSAQPQPNGQGAPDSSRGDSGRQDRSQSPPGAAPDGAPSQPGPEQRQPRPDAGRDERGQESPAPGEQPPGKGPQPEAQPGQQPEAATAAAGGRGQAGDAMSREQALDLLRALDRDEAELRRSIQKRLQGRPTGSGKRW